MLYILAKTEFPYRI